MNNAPRIFPKGGRGQGLLGFSKVDPALKDTVAGIFAKYPALAAHQQDYAVFQGRPMTPGDGRQLESYPTSETWNPMPGNATTEVYNPDPAVQQNLIAGDMLHHMGATDEATGQPVDPGYSAMKSDLLGSMTPEQTAQNRAAYDYYRQRGWNGTFEDFMNASRGDEFIMGSLTPDKGDYWRGRPGTHQKSMYTPEQDTILNKMKHYLAGGK